MLPMKAREVPRAATHASAAQVSVVQGVTQNAQRTTVRPLSPPEVCRATSREDDSSAGPLR
jgi:hypothetical protein